MAESILSPDSTLQEGKYRIIRILGQGGFGITYLAEHTVLAKKVAIKEFYPKDHLSYSASTSHVTMASGQMTFEQHLRDKFLKEARHLAQLKHPNIVAIQDIFEENDTAFYVMDFIEGESLKDMIERKDGFDEKIALKYIREIADAVGHMHSMRINHLDIKPSNIMVRETDDTAMVIDFGTSKQYNDNDEETSVNLPGYTHGYAPVEQYSPKGVSSFTPPTDIYALGATLYTMLAGEKPPHYSEVIESGLPQIKSKEVSERTKRAIEHAMAGAKTERPQNVDEFLNELPTDEEEETDNITETSTIPTNEKNVTQTSDLEKKDVSEIDKNNVTSKIAVPHANQPIMPPPTLPAAKSKERGGYSNYVLLTIGAIVIVVGIVAFFMFRKYGTPVNTDSGTEEMSRMDNPADEVIADGDGYLEDKNVVETLSRVITIDNPLCKCRYSVEAGGGKLTIQRTRTLVNDMTGKEYTDLDNFQLEYPESISPERIVWQMEGLAYYWGACDALNKLARENVTVSANQLDEVRDLLKNSADAFSSTKGALPGSAAKINEGIAKLESLNAGRTDIARKAVDRLANILREEKINTDINI